MATVLRIKRSSAAATATPSTLKPSELAYAEGTSTYTDAQGQSVVSAGVLYYGRGVDGNGNASSIDIIGGKFYTDLLDHGHGTITANSAAIVDSASKVNVWNVDNITLDGNTISTTNANGDLTVDTNGTGDVILSGTSTVGDNRFIINDGSTNRFVVDSFSGAVDITTPTLTAADTLINVSSTWNNPNAVFYGIDLDITDSQSDSNSRLINLSVGNTPKFSVDAAGTVRMTGNIQFANATSFEIQDDTTDAFTVKEGTNKYIDIDTNNGSELITFGTSNVDIDNNLNIDGGNLTTGQSAFNLLETNATQINAFGTATAIDVGATTGTFTLNNPNLVGTQTTQWVFNSTATTVNAFGAASALNIGASGGTTTLRSGTLVGTESLQNVFNTTATTVNAFGAAATINIGGPATDTVNIGDDATTVDFGDLRILGSTIYSDNANAQTITIDPYPGGGDAGGNVVVRGNLQVAGTTTTVNSTQMTINDPVFTLGDSISEKTVTASANSGQADVVLDNVEGLNAGDVVSGNAAVPNGTTISSIDNNTNTVTLSANLTQGIAASANEAVVTLTFTQGADDNQDRGIEFKYYNGGLKTGFFGYDESGTAEGGTTTYYFTYIPDATNASQVFSGTVGKAYFDTVKLEIGNLNGVPFFDQYKRLTTTATPGAADISTSDKILTTNGATGVPIWTDTLDGGSF